MRPEATGYGTVYFVQEILKTRGRSFENLRVSASGSGNVEQHAVEKATERLIKNGVLCVAEGANMPSTIDAVKAFEAAGVLYAPGKASNAGGVTTSGLEMSQNAVRLSWQCNEVDGRLLRIMTGIHAAGIEYGKRPDGTVSYVDGAAIAGFVKVADAMLTQGVV